MKIINKKNNQIIFAAEMEEGLANAIRRYVGQIPILAIDELEISKNDSALYDETIAHRMGLIPLEMAKSVSEKGVKLKLSVKKEGPVESGELKGSIKPVYDKIPITILNKGQELELTATVKFGKGAEHAKFSPGLMIYRNIADVKVDKDVPLGVVDICPKNVLVVENGKLKTQETIRCDMCEACVDLTKKKGKGVIKLEPTKELLITLESFGQLSVGDVFKKAIEILKKDLAAVQKQIAKG